MRRSQGWAQAALASPSAPAPWCFWPPATCLFLPGRAQSSVTARESRALEAPQPLPRGLLAAGGALDRSATALDLGLPSHEKAGMLMTSPLSQGRRQQAPDKHSDPAPPKGPGNLGPLARATLSPACGVALTPGTLGPGGAPGHPGFWRLCLKAPHTRLPGAPGSPGLRGPVGAQQWVPGGRAPSRGPAGFPPKGGGGGHRPHTTSHAQGHTPR